MTTLEVSNCCKADAEYIHNDKHDGFICQKCFKYCDIVEVCAECLGTGEVETGEYDDIRTERCPVCNLKDEEYNDQDK